MRVRGGSYQYVHPVPDSRIKCVCVCVSVFVYTCRYPEFAPMFKAELWDPDEWANLFKAAGAKCNTHTHTHTHTET